MKTGAILVYVVWAVGGVASASQLPADGNAKNPRAATELENAVMRGDLSSVRVLIAAGADVNAKESSGRTALSWAAQYGQLEIVRALAQAGADLNVKDQDGGTPLSLAVWAEHFAVAQALLDEGATVDREQTREKLNAKTASGFTPLDGAAIKGDLTAVRVLMELGADPKAAHNSGAEVLAAAAASGKLDLARDLIQAGVDPNLKDRQGGTSLMLASQKGYTAIVQSLIGAGAGVNAESPHRASALMLASSSGHLDTVRVLIQAGANVNYRTQDGIDALRLARWFCHADVVEALTRAGAITEPGEWKQVPRFEDLPNSRIYKGAPAPVDLHSNPNAPSFRTRLREGARKGSNFAGHYTVVGWGCGSNCESTMVVDALTGRVYDGIGDERGAEFKINSNLVIADPGGGPGATGYPDNPTDSLPVRYYVWSDHRFKLIYERACTVIGKNQKCGCD